MQKKGVEDLCVHVVCSMKSCNDVIKYSFRHNLTSAPLCFLQRSAPAFNNEYL